MNDLKRSNTVSRGILPDMHSNGISELSVMLEWKQEEKGPSFSLGPPISMVQIHWISPIIKHYQLVCPCALNGYTQKGRFLSLSSLEPAKKQQSSSGMWPRCQLMYQNREMFVPLKALPSRVHVKLSRPQPFLFLFYNKEGGQGSWILDRDKEVLSIFIHEDEN